MDKYGVQNEVLHEGLRNEEANLMQEMQAIMTGGEKTASQRADVEAKLAAVRAKISELDLVQGKKR